MVKIQANDSRAVVVDKDGAREIVDTNLGKCSNLAMKLTRALIDDLEFRSFGDDEVAVFNWMVRNIVIIEKGSSNED